MPHLSTIHSQLTTADIHTIIRWNHADEAARLAEAVLAGDVGKVSHQLVDDTFWLLVDTIPTWDQLDTAGVIDHGALTGLGDDDHTQYVPTAGTRAQDGALFTERADHVNTPAAGFGEYWARSDSPTTPIFTDDDGTDHVLNAASESNLHALTDTFGGNILMLWQGNNANTDATTNHTLGTQGTPEYGAGYVPGTHAGYGTEGNGNWWTTAVAQSGGGETNHRRGGGEAVSAYALVYFDEATSNSTPYFFMSGVGGAGSTINYALVLVGEELTYQDSGAGGTVGSLVRIPRKVWTHIGFTRDASDIVKIYMNGTLIHTTGALSTPTAAGDFYIGSAGVAANGYCQFARIQSVKVLDVTITDAQMLAEARRMLGR